MQGSDLLVVFIRKLRVRARRYGRNGCRPALSVWGLNKATAAHGGCRWRLLFLTNTGEGRDKRSTCQSRLLSLSGLLSSGGDSEMRNSYAKINLA